MWPQALRTWSAFAFCAIALASCQTLVGVQDITLAGGSGGMAVADPTCGGYFVDPLQTTWSGCEYCASMSCCAAATACQQDITCRRCVTDPTGSGCQLSKGKPNLLLAALADCLTNNGVLPVSDGKVSGSCASVCAPSTPCDAAPNPPSGGSCVAGDDPAFVCNPVTGQGCPADQVCTFDGASTSCTASPESLGVCGSCLGPGNIAMCGSGSVCFSYSLVEAGVCAKYCCDDNDCGSGFCDTSFGTIMGSSSVFGICTVAFPANDNGTGGAGDSTGGAGGAAGSDATGGTGGSSTSTGGANAAGGAAPSSICGTSFTTGIPGCDQCLGNVPECCSAAQTCAGEALCASCLGGSSAPACDNDPDVIAFDSCPSQGCTSVCAGGSGGSSG